MKAFMDPKTGEMRAPTAAELAAMERQNAGKLEATTEPRQTETKLRKRGTAITMDGMEQPLQGCTGPDGEIVVDHNCQATQDSKGAKP